MKLGILTAVWQRYDVLETFKEGIERLKQHSNIEIEVVAVGSEGKKSANACKEFHYVPFKNKPLSNKWNAGMLKMKELNVDYVLCLGSDDLMCNNALDKYIEAMEQGFDFIGLLDCFIYDTKTNDLRFWVGYNGKRIGETAGIGRCLSSRLLEQMSYLPWGDGIDRGLDGAMFKELKNINHTQKLFGCLKDNIFAVDLKDSQSLTGFQHFAKYPKFHPQDMFNKLPETKVYE
jgi:hypothetical protein